MQEKYYLITFNNTYEVMKAESDLKKKNIAIKIIPVPNEISISCGQGIRTEESLEIVKDHLKDILFKDIYLIQKQFFIKKIKKIEF